MSDTKTFDQRISGPWRYQRADGFQAFEEAQGWLTDQTFQEQLDNKRRTIDLFKKLKPELSTDEIAQNLPGLFESFTGQKAVGNVNFFERTADQFSKAWGSASAGWDYLLAEAVKGGLKPFTDAVDTLGASPPIKALSEKTKVAVGDNSAKASEGVNQSRRAMAQTAIEHGGDWWVPFADNGAQLAASMGMIVPESLAGAALAGPVGAAIGAWDASSRMMVGDSYQTMRERGLSHEEAFPSSVLTGYIAGAVETLGLGAIGHTVVKPMIKQTIMASAPAVARALAANALKSATAVGIGTTEEVLQEGVMIAGENLSYGAHNIKNGGSWSGIDAAKTSGDVYRQAIEKRLVEYNSEALIPLDNVQDIANRLVDTAVSSAIGMVALGGLGFAGGTAHSLKTIKEWDKAGVMREKIAAVGQDIKASQEVAAAQPVPTPGPIKTEVVDGTGEAITVYHPADPSAFALAGNGLPFYTDRARAEKASRETSTAPLEPNALMQTLRAKYPAQLADAALAVINKGREAAAPFEDGLKAWNEQNPTMDYQQILDLALSIHDGTPLENRNDIVVNYGLQDALPTGGIVEAKIQADKVAHVDAEHQIAQAFKDGAQAVEFGGVWHVKDAKHVVVTAKTDSRTEAAVKNPAGKVTYQANEGTIRALAANGKEAGRVRVNVVGDRVEVRDLFTAPEFRNQGVARGLVKRIMDQHPGKVIDWGKVSDPGASFFIDNMRQDSPARKYRPLLNKAEAEGNQALAEFYRQKVDKITADPMSTNEMTPDEFRRVLTLGTSLSHDEVNAVMELVNRFEAAAGLHSGEFLHRALSALQTENVITDKQGGLHERANGVLLRDKAFGIDALTNAYKGILRLARGRSDVTTVVHELTHAVRPFLSREDQGSLLAWTGETEWTTKAEELVARGMEQRILEQKSFGDVVDAILDKMRGWFRILYDSALGDRVLQAGDGQGGLHDVNLTDESRAVFDRLLSGTPPMTEAPSFGQSTVPMSEIYQEETPEQQAVRQKYENTPGWMKAPNGLPSKLNERQWLHVRTPSFKRWFGDWESAFKKAFLKGDPVATVQSGVIHKTDAMSAIEAAKAWVTTNATGDVQTPFGIARLDARAVGDSLSHTMYQRKLDSIQALKEVLQKGVYLGALPDKDGQPIDNHYMAAPVKIGNDATIVFVRLRQDTNGTRFYVHEVFTEDQKKELESHQTAAEPEGSKPHGGLKLYKSILRDALSVKDEEVSKVVDENGEPLVVYHGSKAAFDTFDRTKLSEGQRGFFFTPVTSEARGYGSPRALFLDIKNPTIYDKGRSTPGTDGEYFTPDTKMEAWVAYQPTQIKSATANNGTYDPANSSTLFQEAWHGSPYRFDKFSTAAIGTGEGAQVYGWGLYFSGNKEVAEWYRKKLNVPEEYVNGEPLDTSKPEHLLALVLTQSIGNVDLAKDDLETMARPGGAKSVALAASQALELLKSGARPAIEMKKPDGQLYKVDIPDDSEMLDWDKAMEDQPKRVYEAVGITAEQIQRHKELEGELNRLDLAGKLDTPEWNSVADELRKMNRAGFWMTGEDFYKTIEKDMSNAPGKFFKDRLDSLKYAGRPDRAASLYLASIGIPGVRYLDGTSRSAGDGSHNYVIFEDHQVNIVETLYQEDLKPSPADETKWGGLIDQFFDGKLVDERRQLSLGATPLVLQNLGAKALPLVTSVKVLKKEVGDENMILSGHAMSRSEVKRILSELHNPVMIYESISPHTPFGVVFVTEMNGKAGLPVVVAVHPEKDTSQGKVNFVASFYPHDLRPTWKQISKDKILYLNTKKAPGFSESHRLQLPGAEKLRASNTKFITEADLVKQPGQTLFQEDYANADQLLTDKQRSLEAFKAGRAAHIEKLAKGKSSDERKTIETVVDEFIANKTKEIEVERAALAEAQANAAKPDARKQAVRDAVTAGKPIPDAWIQQYLPEPWAQAELDRRTDLRDQLEHARGFDDLDTYLASVVEDRVMEAMGDPFESVLTEEQWAAAEKQAKADAVLMPDDHERFSQIFGIAHAKTPEVLDKEFADSLTPEKVKMILAGMNQGGYIADKNLPQHVTAQVTKSYEGGTVTESEIPRILKTMKNDPRTYRRIAQQGFADLAELEMLAIEQKVEQAAKVQATEEFAPEIKPIEIPSDLNFTDAAAIRLGTKSRMEWQRKALDAQKELGNLDRTLGILERLSDRWTVAVQDKEKTDYSAEDLAALAELAKENTGKLQNALRALITDSGKDQAKNADRTAKVFLELVKLVRSEMKTKEAARRAYADTAEEMRKMGAYLSKPAPKTIYVEQARMIEMKRALIDPHFRTQKKAELLALEAEWYAAHPDAIVPRNRRGELYGKNLNLWTYEELHAAYLERKALEDMGREKMIARKLNAENRRYLIGQKIVEAVYNKGAVLEARIQAAKDAGDTVERERLAQKYLEWSMKKAQNLRNINDQTAARFNYGLSNWFLTVSNLADKMDGLADYKGINHEMLWSKPNAAENAALKEMDRRKVAMFAWIKENGIKVGELKNRVKVEGVEGSFSLDALLTVYVGQKNARKEAALRFGNRIDERVFAFVNKDEGMAWLRKLGDHLISEYEANKGRLFEVVAEYQNIDMGEEENYTPMIRTEVNQEGLDQQLDYEQGVAMAVRRASIEKGFTNNRIDIGEDHQKPIKMGEFTQWLEMVGKQEQYIAFTPIVKELNALYVDNSQVKDAIKTTYGTKALKEIDTYIKSLADRYHDKTFNGLDEIMAKLSGNAALAYMAYNLATVLKQLSSLPLFIPHARTDLLLVSLAKMATPWALLKKVNSLSIQMKTRIGYAELDEFRLGGQLATGSSTKVGAAIKAGLKATENAMHHIADPGMKPMQWMDKLVAAAGWDAAYETAKAKGMLEDAAVEYADWVVGKTQQSTHVKDTAGVMRSNNSLVKAATLFAGPAVKAYNEIIYGTRALAKNGHYLKSLGTLGAVAASSLIFYGIGKGSPPEGEEWWQWILLGAVNQVPLAGPAVASVTQGYGASNILLNQALETVAKTGQSLTTALDQAESQTKRDNAWGRVGKETLDLAGLGFGAPVSPVKRIWKAAETGYAGELVGWHETKK